MPTRSKQELYGDVYCTSGHSGSLRSKSLAQFDEAPAFVAPMCYATLLCCCMCCHLVVSVIIDIPPCIKEIMAEYSIVKLIDGSNFQQIRDEWFRSLALFHVVRLSEASF